jgi:hypothetical protein
MGSASPIQLCPLTPGGTTRFFPSQNNKYAIFNQVVYSPYDGEVFDVEEKKDKGSDSSFYLLYFLFFLFYTIPTKPPCPPSLTLPLRGGEGRGGGGYFLAKNNSYQLII